MAGKEMKTASLFVAPKNPNLMGGWVGVRISAHSLMGRITFYGPRFWAILKPYKECEIPETPFHLLPPGVISNLKLEIRKPEKEFLVEEEGQQIVDPFPRVTQQDIHLRRLLGHRMRRLSNDEIILSYNDVVLRRSDLHILGGPCYLNDRIIEFYLSYLSASYPSDQILMISPSIAFWIMNCPDVESLRDFMEPLNLLSRNLVIFPVNNNDEVDRAEGGSHWSLLAFERNANLFVHHDSSKGMNDFFANRLYEAVVGIVGGSSDTRAEPRYVKCSSSPQQQNGYDCGLYVLAIAKQIHDWYRDSGSQDKEGLWFSAVKERVTPSAVSRLRGEISELIRGLMASR